jgi:hypothetical protein
MTAYPDPEIPAEALAGFALVALSDWGAKDRQPVELTDDARSLIERIVDHTPASRAEADAALDEIRMPLAKRRAVAKWLDNAQRFVDECPPGFIGFAANLRRIARRVLGESSRIGAGR